MDRLIRRDRYTDRLMLLWVGLGMFMFGYAQPDIFLHSGISNALALCTKAGTLMIFVSLFTSIKPAWNDRTHWGKLLIAWIALWHIFMVVEYEPLDVLGLPNYFDPYCYTLYLFPLVLFVPPIPLVRSFYFINRYLVPVGMVMLCLPLIYFTGFGAIQFIFEGFIMGAALILMTSKYHTTRQQWIAAAALILGFLVATITARRNLMMTTMLYMLGGGYMILFRGKKIARSTQIFVLMSGVTAALLAAMVFLLNSNGVFAKIAGRAGDNTRDYVFLLFFWDMLQTPLDMILGRGIRGAYECRGVDGNGNEMRSAVENGYLQLMLKGGIIYIVAYVTLFITAIRQAWHSTNQLCRASIIVLCIQLFDMLPFGLHAVNLKTFMIWMCASICLCSSLWSKSDDEILDLLTTKKTRLPHWDR